MFKGLFRKKRDDDDDEDRGDGPDDLLILKKIGEDERRKFFEGRPGRDEWPAIASRRRAARHVTNFEKMDFKVRL